MLLIIEHEEEASVRLKRNVRLDGLRTIVVESVRDALFLLNSAPAQVILVSLQAIGSAEELDLLADYIAFHEVPTVFIEGPDDGPAHGRRLRSIGHDGFISRPFRPAELIARLQRARQEHDPLIGAAIGPPGHQINIVKKLGSGAMGVVYEAAQPSLDRRVAVKLLAANLEHDRGGARERFLREARAMAQMRSPNIVQVYFVGEHSHRPYMVMEHISGPDLATYLRQRPRLEVAEALSICRQTLDGLAHAHQRGKIHRDIKPANIMLGPERQVIILDLGLVRDSRATELTQAGMVLGTPRYISPEQIRGAGIDHRSDLYSVGIMLYEMLVGRPPFRDRDQMSLLVKHVSEPLPPPIKLGVHLDSTLFAIVTKLAAKEPDQRFQTASDAAAAIDSYVSSAGLSSLSQVSCSPRPPSLHSGARTAAALSTTDREAAPGSSTGASTGSRTPSGSGPVQSIVFSSEPVPDQVVEQLLDLYSEYLGPLARRVAARDTRDVGLDLENIPARSWPALLNQLAARIDNESKRDAFVDRAVLLKRGF